MEDLRHPQTPCFSIEEVGLTWRTPRWLTALPLGSGGPRHAPPAGRARASPRSTARWPPGRDATSSGGPITSHQHAGTNHRSPTPTRIPHHRSRTPTLISHHHSRITTLILNHHSRAPTVIPNRRSRNTGITEEAKKKTAGQARWILPLFARPDAAQLGLLLAIHAASGREQRARPVATLY